MPCNFSVLVWDIVLCNPDGSLRPAAEEGAGLRSLISIRSSCETGIDVDDFEVLDGGGFRVGYSDSLGVGLRRRFLVEPRHGVIHFLSVVRHAEEGSKLRIVVR